MEQKLALLFFLRQVDSNYFVHQTSIRSKAIIRQTVPQMGDSPHLIGLVRKEIDSYERKPKFL